MLTSVDTRDDKVVLDGHLLAERYSRVRNATATLASPLSEADACIQSMPMASPAKWHLAHTSWFFETMVLAPHKPGYVPFHPLYRHLFNSYYDTVGSRHPREARGLLSRPTLGDVLRYREHVDAAVHQFLSAGTSPAALQLIELGIHHEQQHQELLLTDILHLFSMNPLSPAYRGRVDMPVDTSLSSALSFATINGGVVHVGHAGQSFSFDSERPRHPVLVQPFSLATRPVSNRDWIEFIEDGGYLDSMLWLSDGWNERTKDGWLLPLYWEERDGEYWSMSLDGLRPVDLDAPIAHISLFEADAYARWRGARLPTEFEWETAASRLPVVGNFLESESLRPTNSVESKHLQQMFGDVWEWTSSSFAPYPGFRAAPGAVGEYNGKFMSGQHVLRGGSCATPESHIRSTYRNFFPPNARWQFSGLRLAKDL